MADWHRISDLENKFPWHPNDEIRAMRKEYEQIRRVKMLEKTNDQVVHECGDDPAKWAKALMKMSNGEFGENFLAYWVGQIISAERRRSTPWRRIDDPENKFPWHEDVLLYREDAGVFMGRYSSAGDWLIDPESAEAAQYDEEELCAVDWWAYCENGCERLYSDMPPTHWMPVPDGPELEGAFAEENTARRRAAVQTIRDEAQRLGLEE